MSRAEINYDYFEWLSNLIAKNRFAKEISYKKLLIFLHNTEFRYSMIRDENRAEDGVELRYRFALSEGYEDDVDYVMEVLDGPCSVFEMMVALALRCEETIMDDPRVGDRTGQWFWGMIVNLGLGYMTDSKFDRRVAEIAISRFLDREYDQDGRGGLFTVAYCDRDLRTVEIWNQMCWYLDSIM